jgi:hypothetical protein
MNKLQTFSIDVLRKLSTLDRSKLYPFAFILTSFRSIIKPEFAEPVFHFLKGNSLVDAVEEEDGVRLNSKGEVFSAQYNNMEYFLDRMFEYLRSQNVPETIGIMADKLKIVLTDDELRLLEAKMSQSGLVYEKKSPGSYYTSFKLNPEGTIALDEYDSYSEYKKESRAFTQISTSSDINQLSVLKAFYDRDEVSFGDFQEKKIFLNCSGGTPRAALLYSIIKDLENRRYIISVGHGVWKIDELGIEAFKASIESAKAAAETSKLTNEELNLNVEKLRQEIFDYAAKKDRSILSLRISVAAFILSLILGVLPYTCRSTKNQHAQKQKPRIEIQGQTNTWFLLTNPKFYITR